ncbi:MAG TPA: hypothetical protein VIL03_04545 [Clostridia bacterium]|jgi:hypothetical protein
MFSIWVRTLTEDKLQKNAIIDFDEKFNKNKFFDYVSNICNELDIPTPVILEKHINHFTSFNNTQFTKGDFVEAVDFDKLILEYCKDED